MLPLQTVARVCVMRYLWLHCTRRRRRRRRCHRTVREPSEKRSQIVIATGYSSLPTFNYFHVI